MSFLDSYYARESDIEFKQYFEEHSIDGTRGNSHMICALDYDKKDHNDYTLQEIFTTSNYIAIAVYDQSGSRTGGWLLSYSHRKCYWMPWHSILFLKNKN